MRTYTARDGRTIECAGGKEVAEKLLAMSGSNLRYEARSCDEVSNYIDTQTGLVTEYRHSFCSPCEGQPEREKMAAELGAAIAKQWPAITTANQSVYMAACTRAMADLRVTRPLIDKRKPEAELRQDAERSAAIDAEQEQKRAATDQQRDDNRKRWSNATRVITFSCIVNDSDAMTDYFGEHTAAAWVIAPDYGDKDMFGPLHAAASLVNLPGATWKEHREKYSGGKGYYIECHIDVDQYPSWIDKSTLVSSNRYDTGRCSFRVQYESWNYGGQHPVHPDVVNRPAPTVISAGAPVAVYGVIVRRNEAMNGIEVVFPARPDRSILDNLQAHGWRWSPRQSLWYTRYTPEQLSWAQETFAA